MSNNFAKKNTIQEYFLPLFERLSNPYPVTRAEIISSIEAELQYILGYRINKLPTNSDQYTIKIWEAEQIKIISDHETRLLNPKINILSYKREKLTIQISGMLCFDSTLLSFQLDC